MQTLRRHKKIVLVVILLVTVLIVSLFVAQCLSKPSLTHVPSPTPTPAPTAFTPAPTATPSPTPVGTPLLQPGEISQYNGTNLTSVRDFIDETLLHPDVAIGGTQTIDPSNYQLTIGGDVNSTLELSYNDVIDNFTAHQQVATLLCVEGWRVTILWQGTLLSDILQQAGADPNATTLIFYASDGYTTSLPLDYVVQNNIMIAYKMNNVTLTPDTGWPFFLVANNQYGYKWIMWLTQIDVSSDSSYLGYWESQGYPNNATIISG